MSAPILRPLRDLVDAARDLALAGGSWLTQTVATTGAWELVRPVVGWLVLVLALLLVLRVIGVGAKLAGRIVTTLAVVIGVIAVTRYLG